MWKSLSARAIIPVTLTVTGFVLVCCILLYAGIKEDMTRNAVQHSLTLADTVIKSTRHAMLRADQETVGNIVDNVGRQQEVEHLRIFNKKGLISFSSDHSETDSYVDKTAGGCLECHLTSTPKATLADMEKARVLEMPERGNIMVITAPIYNDPTCFSAACHVHSSEQKTLGILDIGLHLSPLEKSLAVLRGRMAGFTLMVLFLTVGGVTALLKRNVLTPIQNLAIFTDKVAHGNLPEGPLKGPMAGGEIGAIAANVRLLHRRLINAKNPPPAEEDEPSQDADNPDQDQPAADAGRDSRDTPSP